MELHDVLNFFGNFWIVGKEAEIMKGKLIKASDNIILECCIDYSILDGIMNNYDLMINGKVLGRNISLISVYCKTGRRDLLNKDTCTAIFMPAEIIIGGIYRSDDILITEINCHYTDLELFLMRSPFKAVHNQSSSVIAELSQIEEVYLDDEICHIDFVFGMYEDFETFKKLIFINDPSVNFKFNSSISLIKAREKFFLWQIY